MIHFPLINHFTNSISTQLDIGILLSIATSRLPLYKALGRLNSHTANWFYDHRTNITKRNWRISKNGSIEKTM